MLSALSRMIQQNWLGLAILLAMVAAFMLLRSPATRVTSTQELDALLVDGTPKVVEFYSDF
jgi:uncharacterized protein YccT (UPF0319 family)